MITKETVLSYIAKRDGEWGWYQLDRAVNVRDLPAGTTLMGLVRELKKNGFITEIPAKPIPKFKITDKGLAQLKLKHNSGT